MSALHQIRLPDDLEKRLRERASKDGTDAETFIVRAVEEKLQSPPSFKELFTPLQQAFAEPAESPEKLEQTFEELRGKVHQSRQAKSS